MSRIRFDQDIQPLSEFRAGVTSFIKQINETRRPLVITQRGKGVAVVLDVAEVVSNAREDRVTGRNAYC